MKTDIELATEIVCAATNGAEYTSHGIGAVVRDATTAAIDSVRRLHDEFDSSTPEGLEWVDSEVKGDGCYGRTSKTTRNNGYSIYYEEEGYQPVFLQTVLTPGTYYETLAEAKQICEDHHANRNSN